MDILECCTLCPHECKVNRMNGQIGRCKMPAEVKISFADLYFYEEPCVSGENGSGAIFFTGCNMECKFCQNYEISQLNRGVKTTVDELSEKMLELQEKKANNINLVTGVTYVTQIIEAIKLARKNGLNIPIVYNSSGYESVETIKLLNGYVDIYLPDLKYYYDDLAENLSGIKKYFENASKAILEMYSQVGNPVFDENGIIKKGLIIRHLVIPNHLLNTKKVLTWITKNLPKEVYISVMTQYFPEYKALKMEDINRKISEEEYTKIEQIVDNLGIENGYMQDLEENEKKYVPKWNKEQ